MKNLFFVSLVFWTGLGLVFGYVGDTRAQGSSRRFTNPDEPIHVAVNQEFTVVLDANPTTGFLWQLSGPPDEGVVKFVRDDYQVPETPGLTGAGGKHAWTFLAVGPGRAAITLTYSRPWEQGVAPLKKVTFNVNVQ